MEKSRINNYPLELLVVNMEVIITILSILSFTLSLFYWVYDERREKEKITVPIMAISSFLSIICLIFIGPPSKFTHDEIMVLIVLFFLIVFLFLTLAEEEKLRVILLGSTLAMIISIIFLNQIVEELPWEEEYIHEIIANPSKFFEIAIFFEYIEWEVIAIVFGMSLLVAILSITGLFDMIAIRTIKTSKGTPKKFLTLVFFLTLILSALLDNTTAIILLSGITITVTRSLNLNPRPYILAEIIATVMAGIITVIGSLPGILIAGSENGNISFFTFSLVNSGFIVAAIVVSLGYCFIVFRKELAETDGGGIDPSALEWLDEWSVVDSKRNLYLGSAVLGVVVIGLVTSSWIGLSVGFIAITGAILALIVTQSDIEHVLKEVEWESILFFIGLFVLVGTLQISGALEVLANAMKDLAGGDPLVIALIMIVVVSLLSAVVANIPVTIALNVVILELLSDEQFRSNNILGQPIEGFLWFTLLYAVTFGGGLTPFGTVTGVIGTQVLSNENQPVSFIEYIKKMVPLSVILLLIGFVYLLIIQALGILPALYG